MKPISTQVLMASGLCFLLGGFIYDIVFAGIPYPDPTPEMSASYALHSHTASLIRRVGLGSDGSVMFDLDGSYLKIWLPALGRKQKTSEDPDPTSPESHESQLKFDS